MLYFVTEVHGKELRVIHKQRICRQEKLPEPSEVGEGNPQGEVGVIPASSGTSIKASNRILSDAPY